MRTRYQSAMSAIFGAIVAPAGFQRDYAVLNLVEDPCLLQGPPGVGKTTLVNATARALFGADAVTLSCYEEAMPEDLLFETEIGQESGKAVNKFRFSVAPRPFMTAPFALLNEANRLSAATLNTFLGVFAEGVISVQAQRLEKARGKVWIDFNPYYGEFDPAFADRMLGSLMVEELGVLDQFSLMRRKFGSGYVRDLAAAVPQALEPDQMFAIWDEVNQVAIPESVAAQATLALNTLRACKVRLGSISSSYRSQLGCEECRYKAACLTAELTRPVLARGSEAVLRLARAAAWYAGRNEVALDDLEVGIRLGLPHRCTLEDEVSGKFENQATWIERRMLPALVAKRREWDRGRKTYAGITKALQAAKPAEAAKLLAAYRKQCRDVTCFTMVRDFAEPSLEAAAKPVAAKLGKALKAMLDGNMAYSKADLGKISDEMAWMPKSVQAEIEPFLSEIEYWMEGEAELSPEAYEAFARAVLALAGSFGAPMIPPKTFPMSPLDASDGKRLGMLGVTVEEGGTVRIRWKASDHRLAKVVRDFA